MTYTLEVVLPQKLSLNQYSTYHHFKLAKVKREFYEAVWAAERSGYMPEPPVKCHYHFRLWGARMDLTNLFGMVKPLEDGIVKEGLLEDDNPDIVKELTLSLERAPESSKRTKRSYCTITITPYGKQETETHS